MSDLEKVRQEIRSRRASPHSQNVVIDISREDTVYRICEEIVDAAFREAPPETREVGK